MSRYEDTSPLRDMLSVTCYYCHGMRVSVVISGVGVESIDRFEL